MLDFLIFALTFVIVLVVAVIYLYPAPAKVTTVPGCPPSDSKTGNLVDIAKAGTLHNFLVDLHDKYGDIASFWWGDQITISIASPELFKEIQSMFDRPAILFMSFANIYGHDSVQYKNGTDGRKFYNTLRTAFTLDAITNYEDIIQSVVSEYKLQLSKLTPDDHLPLNKTTFAIAIKTNAMVSFGYMFKDDKIVNQLWRAYDSVTHEWEKLSNLEQPDITGTKFEKDKNLMYSTIRSAIEAHQKNKKSDDYPIFADILCDLSKNDDEMIQNAVAYFISSFHTTGLLLTWSLYFLATHQDIQDNVLAEIEDVLGQEKMTVSAVSSLKYTTQVLYETLRCATLATWGGRVQDFDSELGGHQISAGTPIVLAYGALNHNEEVWDDPTKFDPERFSPENFKSRLPSAFQVFGSGKRKCPGYNLALYDAYVTLADMLRAYKFHLVEGQIVVPNYEFVTKPTDEIWLTVEKRS